MATSNEENPRENDIGSISNWKKIAVSRPKKITTFKTNSAIPILRLPLVANGVISHATQKLRRKKLIPMNKPPMSNAIGSIILVCPSAANNPNTKIPCHNSIRSIVLLDATSIPLTCKKSYPLHESSKGPGKSDCRNCYQEPGRRAQVFVQEISYQQATEDRARKLKSYPTYRPALRRKGV